VPTHDPGLLEKQPATDVSGLKVLHLWRKAEHHPHKLATDCGAVSSPDSRPSSREEVSSTDAPAQLITGKTI
jgi:hypothetical protein